MSSQRTFSLAGVIIEDTDGPSDSASGHVGASRRQLKYEDSRSNIRRPSNAVPLRSAQQRASPVSVRDMAGGDNVPMNAFGASVSSAEVNRASDSDKIMSLKLSLSPFSMGAFPTRLVDSLPTDFARPAKKWFSYMNLLVC